MLYGIFRQPDSEITWPDPIPTQGTNRKGKTEDKAKSGTQNEYQANDQAEYFSVDDEPFDTPQELEMSLYNGTEDEALYSEELGQVERKEVDHCRWVSRLILWCSTESNEFQDRSLKSSTQQIWCIWESLFWKKVQAQCVGCLTDYYV